MDCIAQLPSTLEYDSTRIRTRYVINGWALITMLQKVL